MKFNPKAELCSLWGKQDKNNMNEENFSPIQPVLEPEKSNAKLIIVIAIIVVIVAITAGVVGYLFAKKTNAPATEPVATQPVAVQQPTTEAVVTQPADETADWKTYTNTKYGFEFKYPQSYSIQDIKEGIVAVKSMSNSGPANLNVQINQEGSLNSLSLDEIMQAKLKSSSTANVQKITIAGQPAYEGVSLGMVSSYAVYLKNGNNFFELMFDTGNRNTLAENKAGLSEDQKTMLSTFKFTEIIAASFDPEKVKIKPSYIFNMSDLSKSREVCGEGWILSIEEQEEIKNLYNNLKHGKLDDAASAIKASQGKSLLWYLVPFCSAMHDSLAATPYKNGIALFIQSGNGLPSVPNKDNYFFGFLAAGDDKIFLYESVITKFFDKSSGSDYEKYLEKGDEYSIKKFNEILKELESEISQGIVNGFFVRKDLQEEYKKFITQF